MSLARPRPLATVLAAVVALTSVGPATANDPTTDPQNGDEPTTSVHAEMLAAYGDEAPGFSPGGVPAKLDAPAPGGGTMGIEGASGGIAALPNGLSHEVFGYLPHYMLGAGALANLRYDRVSTIAYFGVEGRRDGTLATATNGAKGWASSAMTTVINRAHERGVRVVLTVTMFGWDAAGKADMAALLTSTVNRQKLARAIAASVKGRNADGVNIDFEPVPIELRSEFTAFVREVRAALSAQRAGGYLTVATMAGAASWATGYDVVALTSPGAADALMVMAYDFHHATSARAGGVAPYDSPHIFAVRRALRDHLAEVPASKLIWGVPYYGRAWTTTSSEVNARTCISTGTCTEKSDAWFYTAMRAEAAEHGRLWDGTGRVPWYRHRTSASGPWLQGYYDDTTSLKQKYDLVKDNGLRGIGIWHLLADGSRTELWDLIATQFGPLPFTDIRDSKFVGDIVWLADTEITSGCTPIAFCPKGAVTRAQMASFLSRFLDLPAATRDYYDDDDGNKHEANINRIAAAGITFGCGARRFCPNGLVLRDQMASFLSRALKLPATSRDHYRDDEGNRHEDAINRFAEADITHGCGTSRYCPKGVVLREQMAAFLHRASRR